jgi:hypothetical protein
MNFLKILRNALTFMFQDTDWFAKVSIGAIMLLFCFLGIGLIFIFGYQVLLLKKLLRNQNETLPEWLPLRPLLKEGVLSLSLILIFLIPFFCVLLLSKYLPLLFGVGIITLFLIPLSQAKFAETGSFWSGIDMISIFQLMTIHWKKIIIFLLFGYFFVWITVCFGWMCIIVGWPFIIFWGILVFSDFVRGAITHQRLTPASVEN